MKDALTWRLYLFSKSILLIGLWALLACGFYQVFTVQTERVISFLGFVVLSACTYEVLQSTIFLFVQRQWSGTVDRKKIFVRLATMWGHTIMCVFTMVLAMSILLFTALELGLAKLIFPLLVGGLAFSFFAYLLSEILVTTLMSGTLASREDYPKFYEHVEKLCQHKLLLKPRLYILDRPEMNACAFGVGFFGQYAIAVTPSLYEKLSSEELEGVLAHELGHILSKDIGLATFVSLITSGCEQIGKYVFQGSALAGTWLAYPIAGSFYLFGKVIFPLGRATLSRLREFSADAWSAHLTGGIAPLVSALQKLTSEREEMEEKKDKKSSAPSLASGLFISHPGTEARVAALQELGNSVQAAVEE